MFRIGEHSAFTRRCPCQEICTSRSQSAAPATSCHVRSDICTSRFTKYCACIRHPSATKSALQDPQRAAALATKSAQSARAQPCQSASQQERFQRTTRNTKMPKRSFRSTLPQISEKEPHVQKSRITAPATKSERAEDHHHVQSTAASATLQSLAPATMTLRRSRDE